VGGELGRHPVEEGVLLTLEVGDRLGEGVPVAGQRVGMPARIACLDVAKWCLGHERTQTGVLGFVFEERELLLCDRQLGTKALETLAHVHQTPLEDRLGHGRSSLRPGAANQSPAQATMGT
jgi:hypothetical protein